MTAVPDAWDECAACGHDRDDHAQGDGNCWGALWEQKPMCPCRGFQDAA